MKPQPKRPILAAVNLAAALVVLAGVLYAGASGAGPLPPLGPMLNPGTGVWTLGADARLPANQTLHLAGLNGPVHIYYEANGTAHISAGTDHDLFMALGYVHASFRLFQMDLQRRQAEGLLSQVVGPGALTSDEFELQLGLVRTAQLNWSLMGADDPARAILTAYSAGVNASMAQQVASGHLPVLFKMLGYQPTPWTPLDSLAIQGIMTQTLDFSDGPLHYALLVKALGYDRAMQWFPINALDQSIQHPYDPGPYHQDALAPLDAPPPAVSATPLPIGEEARPGVGSAEADAASALLARMAALPAGAIHRDGNSNNWAVDGTKTASGMPLMAGDPHLHQTLPAIWYQVQYDAPGFHVAGVSIPGLPGALIGHNQHISWSLTNTQNAATFYYQERTDAAHPGQYFWNGGWHPLQVLHYSIPVKRRAAVGFDVKATVHGPLMVQAGQTLSVWWAGALPSRGIDALLGVNQASNFQQFREALRIWHAPTQNFVYADDQGNIGLISAGYYPQVKAGQPWLPLPGDGSADVVGTVPYDDIPQVYNPPTHFVWSANQREVGASYPYYIGTSLEFFDPGYRAAQIYQTLNASSQLTAADMERLQNDTHDFLASVMVPQLVTALRGQALAPREQQAADLLGQWDNDMRADSAAATIWMRFWTQYLYEVFHPWWAAAKMPTKQDPDLDLSPKQTSYLSGVLGEDLVAWTHDDPTNAAFSLPNGTARAAPMVMRTAFANAVAALAKQLGPDPQSWTWGRVHTREFANLAQIDSLGYGPRPASGGPWTVNAATSGEFNATHGPSWRFVMDWSTRQGRGVYPGGQSENPLSPWYENQIPAWWDGTYYPMLSADQARTAADTRTWTIEP